MSRRTDARNNVSESLPAASKVRSRSPLEMLPTSFWHVFLLALALRLFFMALYAWKIPVQWGGRAFSGYEMGWIAFNLAHGHGFSSPFSEGSQPTAWLCPLIPALWAAIMKVTGEATGRTEGIIVALQAVASSLSAALYVRIFRRVAPGASTTLAGLFTAAVVLWPESFLRLVYIWYFPWQELIIAALVWFGIRWFDERTTASAVTLGITGGIAGLINVSPVPVFALVLALPVLRFRKRLVLARACIGGLVALAIVLPWLARNRMVFGEFVPLRGNTGLELLQGNNPAGTPRQTETSLHPYHTPAELRRYQAMGEVEYNREALHRALDWIEHHPVAAAVKTAERVYVAWFTDLTDAWSWNQTKYWQVRYTLVLQLTTIFCALIPLALAVYGVWRVGFRAIPYHWLLFAPFLATVPHYFTQVEDAYVTYVRLWLLMIAAVCFHVMARRDAGQPAAAAVLASPPKPHRRLDALAP